MSYTITRECLGILLLRIILLTAVIVSWINADTSIALSSSGINVCGVCNSNQELVNSCCEGWSQGIQDNDTCLTPVCDPSCDHGDCTSPDVCTCLSGFVGETCDIVSDKEYDSRLLHGTQSDRGIVQVRSTTGELSLVNPDNWMRMNSHVLCRQLGFSFAMSQSTGRWQFPEDSSPTLGVRFECSGSEENLQDCDVMDDLPQSEMMLAIQCKSGDLMPLCGSGCSQDTFTRTGCKCDPLCEGYGDCCPDFSTNTNCPASNIVNVVASCMAIPLYRPYVQIHPDFQLGYFIVSTCADSYPWDGDDIAKGCEGEADLEDPFTFTPVQINNAYDADHVVYRNVFCAQCNHQHWQNMVPWNYEVVNNLIVGVRPPLLSDRPRTCYIIDDEAKACVGYHDQITEGCEVNYAPILVNGRVYRNLLCAVCDDVYPGNGNIQLELPLVADRHNPNCGLTVITSNQSVVSVSHNVFPVHIAPDLFTLFDFADTDDQQCPQGQVFDQYQSRCRLLSCPSGYLLVEGTCDAIPLDLIVLEPIPILNAPAPEEQPRNKSAAHDCVELLLIQNDEEVDNTHYNQSLAAFTSKLEISENINALVVNVIDIHTFMDMFVKLEMAMVQSAPNNDTTDDHDDVVSLGIPPFCNVSTLTLTLQDPASKSLNLSHVVCNRDVLRDGYLSRLNQSTSNNLESIFTRNSTSRMTATYSWEARQGRYFMNLTAVVCRPSVACQEIELGPREYSFIGNSSSILHDASGQILLEDDYRVGENGTIRVCYSLLYDYYYGHPNRFETALRWISFVFFILSLIATFATFLSYCVFRELRNITGQITMNFLFAFFVAQLMFLLAPTLLISKDLCISSAIINHFTWLGGFFWMNALSLVTTKTLTRKTVLLNKSNVMRFLAPYAAYAWGGPVLIVAVCVTLHFCDCTAIAPIYGVKNGAICWLVGHDGYASLWGFAAPVGVLLLFNTVLFIYAVVHFRRKISSARSTKKSKRLTLEATIYIKLTILMGLPWLLGFLQIFVTNIVLNYIYTILNSLQGVFVFMALVVTGRAGKLWRRKLCHGQSTISSASGKSKPYMQSTVKTNTTSFTSSVSKTDPNTYGYDESSESRVRSPVQSVSVGVTNDCRESSEGRVRSPVVESINAGFANDCCESFEGRVTSPVRSSRAGVSNDYRESSEGRVSTSPVVESTNAGVANDSSESSEDRATSPVAESNSADVTNHRVRVMF